MFLKTPLPVAVNNLRAPPTTPGVAISTTNLPTGPKSYPIIFST